MGKLSPELRNMIYELVLGNIPVKISCEYWGKPPLTSGPRPKHLALTETCKQIQDESIPIFYGMNEFTFTVTPSAGSSAFNGRADLASPHALYRLRDLLGSIESKKLGMMKQVKLQIGFADPKVFYVEAEVLMQFAGFLRAAGMG